MSCHDCTVEEGYIHKFGCDMERCPFCGEQLITCGCVYEKLNIDCYPFSPVYKYGLTEKQENDWLIRLNRKGRVPYIVYPNMCNRCGKLWPDMFTVSDQEWQKYIQIDARHVVLCRACFDIIKSLIDKAKAQPSPVSNLEERVK